MKDEPDSLDQILNGWEAAPTPVDEICRGVWRRIERLESRSKAMPTGYLDRLAMRPAFASCVLMLAIIAGGLIGSMASSSAHTESYLQSLSPFLQIR